MSPEHREIPESPAPGDTGLNVPEDGDGQDGCSADTQRDPGRGSCPKPLVSADKVKLLGGVWASHSLIHSLTHSFIHGLPRPSAVAGAALSTGNTHVTGSVHTEGRSCDLAEQKEQSPPIRPKGVR